MFDTFLKSLRSHFSRVQFSRVGERWGRLKLAQESSGFVKNRWWQFITIRNEINRYLGLDITGQGVVQMARDIYKILPSEKAVSIGCGNAGKEIDLVRKGLVASFDLYELSESRLNEAMEASKRYGVYDAFTFNRENVFERDLPSESYDLVYWDNSLHHMLDVEEAIAWSHKVLKPGGGLLINDFIGASRFQWPAEQLTYAKQVRECFSGTKYLKDSSGENVDLSLTIKKPTKLGMWLDDPSEAADSDRIIDSVDEYFPNAHIHNLGGVVYHLALNDMLVNFDDSEDRHILKLLMMIDGFISKEGQNHYAAIFATKL